MLTLRRLIISPRPFTDKQKREREAMVSFLAIPGVLEIKNEYRHVPDILSKLKLEAGEGGYDLDEDSIKAAISEPGYHNIHLKLTTHEWTTLGIRKTLYGQSQEINGQAITYGRPGKNLKRYSNEIRAVFTEETLTEWHELDHGIRALLNIDTPSTHYHFYGYATKYKDMPKAEQNKVNPPRWARKPDPIDGWIAIPWHRLEENTDVIKKISLLTEAIRLMTILLGLKQKKLVKPLRDWDLVSQAYGNYNPHLYALTGHHIGTDFAVPEGTPIYAPADGELIESGYTAALGNYVVYQYADNRWLVALHLNAKVALGKYKAGMIIGNVGATGLITGIHSHLEVWTVKPNRQSPGAIINKDNWREVTRDPLKEF